MIYIPFIYFLSKSIHIPNLTNNSQYIYQFKVNFTIQKVNLNFLPLVQIFVNEITKILKESFPKQSRFNDRPPKKVVLKLPKTHFFLLNDA